MASSGRSLRFFVAEELGGFPHFLIWAILEWILIASLYIDGFVAFISSAFAKIFELEPPCVLCTRVDHVLVGKDPNTYYNESICECHKRDISCLAYCHVHGKLSDIQHMCDGCLLSFATEKESGRKIVLKLVDDRNSSNESVLDVKRCSCCGEPFKTTAPSKDYSRSFSNSRASGIATSSSPRVISSPRAISCFTPTWKTEDSLYTELKFISDSELDMPEYDFGFSIDAKKIREDMKSGIMSLLTGSSEENEEACKTNFFGISLTDATTVSPGFAIKALKKGSLEKSDSLSETNDETSSGNGDSTIKQLKKQARLDRKALQLLSMELEEERSAAAVAANNAMAMITRLQEEKASVQMEALQYQRMMEEQSEYDQEAIQILQDVLAKRDEYVRVMESELDSYREKFGDIRKVDIDECECEADEYYQEWRSQSSSSFGEKSEPATLFENVYEEPMSPFENDPVVMSPQDFQDSRDHEEDSQSYSGRSVKNGRGGAFEEPLLDFEIEKYQLYSMLKDLENHIQSSSLEDEDDDKHTEQESRAILNREVSLIKERLRALEADSGFLKHTAMTLQKGEKGAELLTEIAQHLRKLCHSEDIDTSQT